MKLARSPANLIAGSGFEPAVSGLLARQVGTIQIVSNNMTNCVSVAQIVTMFSQVE